MDKFTPRLLELGLAASSQGRAQRGRGGILRKNGGIYFCAIGGAGALMAKHVVAAEEIAFNDLGCESIKKLTWRGSPSPWPSTAPAAISSRRAGPNTGNKAKAGDQLSPAFYISISMISRPCRMA
jgi:hypothetical protein